jgi:hypothetical protein
MRPHFLRRSEWVQGSDTTPFTTKTLREAVDQWCDRNDRRHKKALAKHGHISGWDVSGVTKMDHLFYGKRSFNDDIGGWDVSKVESMVSMFHNAGKFNQSLEDWKLSETICKNLGRRTLDMFVGAKNFTSKKPKALSARAARA